MATATMKQHIVGSLMASRLGQKYAKKKLGENMDILTCFQEILAAEGREEEARMLIKNTLSLCAKLAVAKSPKGNKENLHQQQQQQQQQQHKSGAACAREAVWVFLEDLHTLCWARLRSGVTENVALDELRTFWAHTREAVQDTLTRRLGQKDVALFDSITAQLETAVTLVLTQPRHGESLAKIKSSLNSLLSARM